MLGYIDPEGEAKKKFTDTLAEAAIVIMEMFSDGDPTNGSLRGRRIDQTLDRKSKID